MSDQSNKFGWLALAFTTAIFLPCMLLAKLASQTRINIVKVDQSTVSKRRVWYANFIRIPGNLILGLRRAPVKVLSTTEWHERVRLLAQAAESKNAVELQFLDGVPLSEYLANADSTEQKLAAVSAALHSLFDFHLQHGQSHGDASSTNVMIDRMPGGKLSATWFDFDVAHKESVAEVVRRADDLRALFFTSKPWLSDAEFKLLFTGSESPYIDNEVWEELIRSMSSPFQHCDIFHIAQQKRAVRTVSDGSGN